MTFVYSLFHLPSIENFYIRRLVAWLIIAVCLSFIVLGLIKRPRPIFFQISALYIALTFLALPLWFALDERYPMLLIPFLTVLLVNGGRVVSLISPVGKGIVWFMVLTVAVSYAHANLLNLRIAKRAESDPLLRGPMETFSWIKGRISPDDVLFCLQAAPLFLYTGRKTLLPLKARNEQDFLRFLDQHNVRYGVLMPRHFSPRSAMAVVDNTVDQNESWISNAKRFNLIYANDKEQTRIYRRRDGG
jgi:hypothetical protein